MSGVSPAVSAGASALRQSSRVVLQCDDVHFRYGSEEVLKGVSMSATEGEVVALLGPSGSGKSTLLYCLAGVLTPAAGTITFDGTPLSSLDDRERTAVRATSFGFVLQFGRLVPELSAAENASIPLRLQGWPRKAAERAALEALHELNVGHLAGRAAASLSGGEQQRVAVTRALIHSPRVVFADEPTGALDSVNGEAVMDALVRMARNRGSAVVLVTHDESLATTADRCVRVRDGVLDRRRTSVP